jgi:hypothetical protein
MVIYYTWWCCGALQVVLGTTAPLSVNCMVDTRRRCCPPYYLQSATILTRNKNNSNAYKCDYIVDNQNIGDPLIAFTDEALSPKAFTNCFHKKLFARVEDSPLELYDASTAFGTTGSSWNNESILNETGPNSVGVGARILVLECSNCFLAV